MYLYVDKRKGLKDLPAPLTDLFGTPIHVLDMLLNDSKKLGRATPEQVLADIKTKGFFLQMPPAEQENLLAEHRKLMGLEPLQRNNHGS